MARITCHGTGVKILEKFGDMREVKKISNEEQEWKKNTIARETFRERGQMGRLQTSDGKPFSVSMIQKGCFGTQAIGLPLLLQTLSLDNGPVKTEE